MRRSQTLQARRSARYRRTIRSSRAPGRSHRARTRRYCSSSAIRRMRPSRIRPRTFFPALDHVRRALMKLRTPLLALAALTTAMLSSAASASVIVGVSLDTSSLEGMAGSPFVLDLQLNDGSGTNDANNTAVVTQLSFGTGSAVGSPTVGGGAAVSAGTITLSDSSFLNSFDQAFQPGSK